MLIAQGESAKYVCDQMGHSSIQVTFDTYGHLFPNSRETAAKKLQQAMFTGRKNGFGSKTRKTQEKDRAAWRRGLISMSLVLCEVRARKFWLRGTATLRTYFGYRSG